MSIAVASIIVAGISAIASLTSGIVNATSTADKERNNQIANLKYQNQQLEDQRKELTRQFEVQQREGNTQILQATEDRDTNAQINAISGVQANKNAYEEFNSLQLSATETLGSQAAANATTGFRNTGTQQRRTEQTESQIARQLDLARDQVNLSIASQFYSSASSYNQSTRNIEAYKRQMEELQSQYDYQYKQLQDQINYNKGTIAELERQKDDGWTGFMDFLGGL